MDLDDIIAEIGEVCEEGSLPRRVREALAKVADDLKLTGQDSAVQVTSAIYELEAIANDVNISVHAKTILWDIISTLESLKTS